MNIKKKAYIALFAVLYLIVAFVSFYHGVHYMSLANDTWMAIILSVAFEVGQAAVLFALLTSKENRGKIMPWLLMAMFTLVQILGNVYSSYKYVVEHSMPLLKYFKEPVFIWTNIPDDQATVIVTYILGATLPLSALALTGMVTSFLHTDDENKSGKPQEEKIEQKTQDEDENAKKIEEPAEKTETDEKLPERTNDVEEQEDEEPVQMITDTAPAPINDELKKSHLVSL